LRVNQLINIRLINKKKHKHIFELGIDTMTVQYVVNKKKLTET